MDFKQALSHSLKVDRRTLADPFLLHSRVSDLVGDDYESRKAAEEFYRLDAKYEISKTILGSAPVRYKKRKKHYYKLKPMPIPPDNAYVYFADSSPTLHIVGECPCLKDASQIYRTTYDHAKILDYKKNHFSNYSLFYKFRYSRSIAKVSQNSQMHICRRCGNSTSKQATGIFYRLVIWIFERMHIDLRRKSNYKT